MGCTRRTMSRTGRGVGLALEGSVAGFGHVGDAVHPVGHGRPVLLGYGLDETAQAGTLADGDGEAIHPERPAANGVGVEAAVGPHLSCWPRRSAPAPPSPSGSGGTPSGVGPALAQPGHQHVAGRPRPTAGDSPSCPCSRGRAPPPWPDRRSRRSYDPGRW